MSAHENHKIIELIKKNGKEAYFHYFTLIEICARQYIEKNDGKTSFKFHASTICAKLLVTRQRLGGHLLAIQCALGGHWVCNDSQVEIEYCKIPEYMGLYDSSVPKKEKKRKEKKEKEIEKNDHTILDSLTPIDEEFHKVICRMTESQQQKLLDSFGFEIVSSYIKQVGSWKDYEKVKDVYRTIVNWISRNGIESQIEIKKKQDAVNKKLEAKCLS